METTIMGYIGLYRVIEGLYRGNGTEGVIGYIEGLSYRGNGI